MFILLPQTVVHLAPALNLSSASMRRVNTLAAVWNRMHNQWQWGGCSRLWGGGVWRTWRGGRSVRVIVCVCVFSILPYAPIIHVAVAHYAASLALLLLTTSPNNSIYYVQSELELIGITQRRKVT